MSNISSTLWIDNKTFDLQAAKSQLLSHHSDDLSETSLNYTNWAVEQLFPEDKTANFNGKETTYNCFKYSFEQFSAGLEDDAVKKDGYIVVFAYNSKIRYIVTRNTGAKTMLRKLLNYSGKGEIERSPLKFNGDMFVWLINKVYLGESLLVSESENLKDLSIDSVRGIKGDTEDYLTRVSAVGESVINIISTLSFLLESQNLNQIKLDIAYGDFANIDLSLNNKSIVSTEFERLQCGSAAGTTDAEKMAYVFILLYTEILPIITQSYQGAIDGNYWSQGKCVEFLKRVAKDLSEKVEKRVADLTDRPEQLKLSFEVSSTDE